MMALIKRCEYLQKILIQSNNQLSETDLFSIRRLRLLYINERNDIEIMFTYVNPNEYCGNETLIKVVNSL